MVSGSQQTSAAEVTSCFNVILGHNASGATAWTSFDDSFSFEAFLDKLTEKGVRIRDEFIVLAQGVPDSDVERVLSKHARDRMPLRAALFAPVIAAMDAECK